MTNNTPTITFLISSFDFTSLWGQFNKQGGRFNDFLVEYYIKEINDKYPELDMVIPKIYLTRGNSYSLTRLLFSASCRVKREGYDTVSMLLKQRDADTLYNNFFVNKKDIKNPIEVGI